MKAKQLRLTNFRAFERLDIDFETDLTVIAGVNGVGKSGSLKAVAKLFSQMLPALTPSKEKAKYSEFSDIRHGFDFYDIVFSVQLPDDRIYTRRDFKVRGQPAWEMSGESLDFMKAKEGEKLNTLAVFYGVQRAFLILPRTKPDKSHLTRVAAYSRALDGDRVDLREFTAWYLVQKKLGLDRKNLLDAVEKAVSKFLPGFQNLKIEADPRPRMSLEKNGDILRVDEMSDGERSVLAMIIDLARRLSIANPDSADPIAEGKAIVLIDEIEQHLHPEWQRVIMRRLMETFPNCQFIVTTHSPQVLGEVEGRCIRYLYRDEGRVCCHIPKQAMGLDSAELLEELMGTPRRNEGVSERLEMIFRLIDEDEFEKAKEEIARLKQDLHGDIPELVRADSLITMLDIPGGERDE